MSLQHYPFRLLQQPDPFRTGRLGSGTGCVAMITASACRVLRWVYGKKTRPEGAPAHDFGSASNHRNIARATAGADGAGARAAWGFRDAGGLPVDHRTGCGPGKDGREGNREARAGVLQADRSHAEDKGGRQAAKTCLTANRQRSRHTYAVVRFHKCLATYGSFSARSGESGERY
jgi:hypothetical protein